MNGSAAFQMPARNPGKPGELPLWTGLALLFAAPVALLIQSQEDGKNALLAAEGVVAEARVVGKDQRSETYSGRQGRTRRQDVYYLMLEYDVNAATPHAQWQVTRRISPSQYPAIASTEIDVPGWAWENLAAGEATSVVWLPADPASLTLTEVFDHETSFAYHMWFYLAAGLAMVAGAALAMFGWRKRRAYG